MPRRRLPVSEERVEEHVDEQVVRRRPPLPSDRPLAWALLLILLIGGGILAGVLLARDEDEEATPTRTVVETRTAPSTTVLQTQTETTTTAPTGRGVMPETLTLEQAAAVRLVEEAGLIPDTYPVDSEAEPGRVVAQNPDAGTQLGEREHVRLNVSNGAGARESIEVPDVTGPAEADARRIAVEAGFTVRTEDSDAPSSEELGEAVDQEPPAGSRAPAWSQITIFVGR